MQTTTHNHKPNKRSECGMVPWMQSRLARLIAFNRKTDRQRARADSLWRQICKAAQ